jgi:hypothetical protein
VSDGVAHDAIGALKYLDKGWQISTAALPEDKTSELDFCIRNSNPNELSARRIL